MEVNKLLVSGDTVWIATSKGLYYQTDIKARPSPVVAGPISNIFFDRNHTLWYTGAGSGIWRQQHGQVPEHFTRDNGLPSNQVLCGCTDLEGIVWLGTENGLAKL